MKSVDEAPPPKAVVLVEESFVQVPFPAVDLLFVVDGTASMSQELQVLGEEAPQIFEVLDDLGIAWQIGVVSADPGGLLRGRPWVLTPHTPEREARMAETFLSVGGVLQAGESGLAAALSALDASREGMNVGFRRPGAALRVVFISDGDDDSELGSDPVTVFTEALNADGEHWGAPASAFALVGDLPSGCASARGTARPGYRYHDVAATTGGIAESICSADLGRVLGQLAELSVVFPNEFPLAQQPSGLPLVWLDDEPTLEGWAVDDALQALVFAVAPAPGTVIRVSYPTTNDGGGP